MIVDDEVALTQLYSMALSKHGYDVTHIAHDGLGAIQAVQSNKENIDIVLMDQKMPNIDGITASLELKNIKPEVHIIMISAYDVPKQEYRNLFDAILRKPVSTEDLYKTVELVRAKSLIS
jgi:CheY-like chemotaxis protein